MTTLFKHVNRRAKIVATLGPQTSTVESIKELIVAGMNIARVNMSHGDHAGHLESINNIRQASRELGDREVAILLDLCGPKIRVDKLPAPLELVDGDEWTIAPKEILNGSEEKCIPSGYKDIANDCTVGDRVLFDDGLLAAKVIAKDDQVLTIKVITGGLLKSNKGINLPDSIVSSPSFTEKDSKDLIFGLANDIDFIALSFVRKPSDVDSVRAFMNERGFNVPIVSKIENPEAVANIDAIIATTDAIMVARGDMGVEVGNHLVPAIQKSIIRKCNAAGISVITATQMLESMISNPTPTRAEASDVANAVWDGTDAVMLSGETAVGKYPAITVGMMCKIIVAAEETPKARPSADSLNLKDDTASLMYGAALIAEKVGANRIVAITETGNTCRTLSRFRPLAFGLGVTNSQQTARKMCLYWGISPFYIKPTQAPGKKLEEEVLATVREKLQLSAGDKLILTRGEGPLFQEGDSNSLRIITIED